MTKEKPGVYKEITKDNGQVVQVYFPPVLKLGARPKYKNPEELRLVVEEYLNSVPFERLTVSGLALAIGSKQSLYDYAEKDGYGHIVNEARLYIESSYEQALRAGQSGAGSIFALKQFGWTDKSEVKVDHGLSDLSKALDQAEQSTGTIPIEDVKQIENKASIYKDTKDKPKNLNESIVSEAREIFRNAGKKGK